MSNIKKQKLEDIIDKTALDHLNIDVSYNIVGGCCLPPGYWRSVMIGLVFLSEQFISFFTCGTFCSQKPLQDLRGLEAGNFGSSKGATLPFKGPLGHEGDSLGSPKGATLPLKSPLGHEGDSLGSPKGATLPLKSPLGLEGDSLGSSKGADLPYTCLTKAIEPGVPNVSVEYTIITPREMFLKPAYTKKLAQKGKSVDMGYHLAYGSPEEGAENSYGITRILCSHQECGSGVSDKYPIDICFYPLPYSVVKPIEQELAVKKINPKSFHHFECDYSRELKKGWAINGIKENPTSCTSPYCLLEKLYDVDEIQQKAIANGEKEESPLAEQRPSPPNHYINFMHAILGPFDNRLFTAGIIGKEELGIHIKFGQEGNHPSEFRNEVFVNVYRDHFNECQDNSIDICCYLLPNRLVNELKCRMNWDKINAFKVPENMHVYLGNHMEKLLNLLQEQTFSRKQLLKALGGSSNEISNYISAAYHIIYDEERIGPIQYDDKGNEIPITEEERENYKYQLFQVEVNHKYCLSTPKDVCLSPLSTAPYRLLNLMNQNKKAILAGKFSGDIYQTMYEIDAGKEGLKN